VVQPWQAGTDTFNIGTLFMLAAALTNSGYQIATRKVRGDDPRTSLLFTAAFGAVLTSAIVPWFWTMPDMKGWMLLAGSGFFGALGHYCIIAAYRNAPASVVAPFSYSSLLWATMLGYLIWADFPASNVWYGAALIITSGLYIFWRERQRNVEPQNLPKPPFPSCERVRQARANALLRQVAPTPGLLLRRPRSS
jgi:drug/metabolite transporter (DMT)-like permease